MITLAAFAAAPHGACRGHTPISALGAGGARRASVYITARKDDPNTFVFYEIYRSQAALDFHLQQDFTKKFVATLKSAQFGDRVQTNLVELAPEEQTYPN
jgi:hypothetical protein